MLSGEKVIAFKYLTLIRIGPKVPLMTIPMQALLPWNQNQPKLYLKDAAVGDVFLKGGSPGHVVMIVDMCENENGKKAFLLALGIFPWIVVLPPYKGWYPMVFWAPVKG